MPVRRGPGDVVLQRRAVAADEILRLLDHHQPPAAEHGHGGQLAQHVAQLGLPPSNTLSEKSASSPPKTASRSFRSDCLRKKASPAEDDADRLGQVFLRLGQIIDGVERLRHADSIKAEGGGRKAEGKDKGEPRGLSPRFPDAAGKRDQTAGINPTADRNPYFGKKSCVTVTSRMLWLSGSKTRILI